VSQPNATEMQRINTVVWKAMGSDSKNESTSALLGLKKIFKKTGRKATDFEIVPAGSCLGDASLNDTAAMEGWTREFDNLTNKLNAARHELAALKAAGTYGFPDQRVQADLRDASNAKAERDAARRQSAKLRTILAKTEAKLDAANRVRDEAQARADAARRENDELRAALQEATAELREAQRVADVRRDAMVQNARADAAGAATDNPTSGVEAHEHHAETVENPACTHPSDDVASDRQQGWNPRFDAKAVGLYWRAVHAINADLEAGLITKKQASGRKASALRDYKSRVKLGSRARNARRAA
jgi:hypothetical protein